MPENYPMGFDWIFFVIVFTPVLIAAWELYRIRKEPKPQLTDPWLSSGKRNQGPSNPNGRCGFCKVGSGRFRSRLPRAPAAVQTRLAATTGFQVCDP